MEPVRSRKMSMEEILAPTRTNPLTGEVELVPAMERIDRIIAHPQAARVVESLDPQIVFSLVRSVGVHDALSLIELATPEQLQAFIDFDSWKKDRFALVNFTEWMEVFLQSDDEKFEALYETMDREAFVLWFRETVAVYEWEADVELLDRIEGQVYTSPCGQFALVIPEEETYGPEVRLFLERLYQLSVEEALTLMSEARWALTSELEEGLFQLRNARLSEHGFVPYDESIAIYGFLDPLRFVRAEREKLQQMETIERALPVGSLAPLEHQLLAVQEALSKEELPYLAHSITQLGTLWGEDTRADVLPSVMAQFRAITQRVLVADGGTPGDPNSTMNASRRAMDTLSLGLEFLADGDEKLATKALATIPMRELHRAGHSIALQMQRQVWEILKRGNLSLTEQPFSLLTAEDAAMCEGLSQTRPLMSSSSQKPFRSMKDVQYVAGRLGQIAFAELLFFAWMGFDRESLLTVLHDEKLNTTPVELVTYRTLFATVLLNRLIDQERALMPMSIEELDQALAKLRKESNPLSFLLDRARALVEALQPTDQKLGQFPFAFIAETVTWIIDETLSHNAPTSREVAQNWVLLRPDGAGAPTHDRPFGKATVH